MYRRRQYLRIDESHDRRHDERKAMPDRTLYERPSTHNYQYEDELSTHASALPEYRELMQIVEFRRLALGTF